MHPFPSQPAFILTALLLAGTAAVHAQDAAVVNAGIITVKVDNERVRVFEAVLEPGQREQLHSHPTSIAYVLAGGKIRMHGADGTVSESEPATGETLYRGPVTHWGENIGTTTLRFLVVELKD